MDRCHLSLTDRTILAAVRSAVYRVFKKRDAMASAHQARPGGSGIMRKRSSMAGRRGGFVPRRAPVKLGDAEALVLFAFLASSSFLLAGISAVTVHALTMTGGDLVASVGTLTRAFGGDRPWTLGWGFWRGGWIGLSAVWVGCAWVMLRYPLGHGSFVGATIVDFEENGHGVRLRRDLVYHDTQGRLWSAPEGTICRGECLPPGVWNLLGPPFFGPHREASIIHEHYCRMRAGVASDVHQMFYEACRAGGVAEPVARLALRELRLHGPGWGGKR